MFGMRFPFCTRACASISMIARLSPHRIFLFLGYGRNIMKKLLRRIFGMEDLSRAERRRRGKENTSKEFRRWVKARNREWYRGRKKW